MRFRAWDGRCGVAMGSRTGHVDVARLHVESTRGWQLGELGIPFGHDETAAGLFNFMQYAHVTEKLKKAKWYPLFSVLH